MCCINYSIGSYFRECTIQWGTFEEEKLSQIFEVLWPFAKVFFFFSQNLGAWHFLVAPASNPPKFSPRFLQFAKSFSPICESFHLIFHQFAKVFSAKVSHCTVISLISHTILQQEVTDCLHLSKKIMTQIFCYALTGSHSRLGTSDRESRTTGVIHAQAPVTGSHVRRESFTPRHQ